ncbi:siroheme decarboxylase subunit beta [Megalodesulfovibrio gigas]|uniref:siroheme decarboxylase n=1 Tax=Megalodesulfovibrio gigas (strain ATCC 19364 / DSM 1382 / NCIMB 9332 / VKM B-1759) TaxID=1121448 RepID=T2GBF4_MEGG1|nr:Lrp/AsnC family transcriptional regulator [Megalodesulfovibrio gigas]AGW13237.1 putative heme biosynthesis protein [Megalodesulfovibrio gigas DSM 1382 = ATCC 19364]
MHQFTPAQRTVLRLAQDQLPDSLTPYADMARQAGITEEEVIALLQSLLEEGVIRRFGASIKHQQAGWNHNVMVAWRIDDDAARDAAGTAMAEHPHVSHCYWRPAQADWPYTLFTMVHGRSPEELQRVVAELSERTGQNDYGLLHSIRELKKTSMVYFQE